LPGYRVRDIRVALFFSLFLISCAGKEPQFNWDFFPERYHLKGLAPLETVSGISFRRLEVKNSAKDLDHLSRFWNHGEYQSVYSRLHPVLKVKSEDVKLVLFFLQNYFRIFYIEILQGKSTKSLEYRKIRSEIIQCNPLTNNELFFILNFGNNEQFSKKNFHLLLIFIHERLHQLGAKPVAPKVISPYLRKKWGLAARRKPEEINLFSNRNQRLENKGGVVSGLLFCRGRQFEQQVKK